MLLSLPEVEEGLAFDKVAFKAGKRISSSWVTMAMGTM